VSAELTKNALLHTVFFGDFANWDSFSRIKERKSL